MLSDLVLDVSALCCSGSLTAAGGGGPDYEDLARAANSLAVAAKALATAAPKSDSGKFSKVHRVLQVHKCVWGSTSRGG